MIRVNIAVYCGSNHGENEKYTVEARKLGEKIVESGLGVVYGGATVGLMGEVAKSALRAGGHVTGVMPKALADLEITLHEASIVIMTSTMHERKQEMFERSRAFVALPGGIGTLEEIVEVWTWAKIGIHQKPIGLINIDGYYDPFLQFIENMKQEGFLKEEDVAPLIVGHTADEVITRISNLLNEQSS